MISIIIVHKRYQPLIFRGQTKGVFEAILSSNIIKSKNYQYVIDSNNDKFNFVLFQKWCIANHIKSITEKVADFENMCAFNHNRWMPSYDKNKSIPTPELNKTELKYQHLIENGFDDLLKLFPAPEAMKWWDDFEINTIRDVNPNELGDKIFVIADSEKSEQIFNWTFETKLLLFNKKISSEKIFISTDGYFSGHFVILPVRDFEHFYPIVYQKYIKKKGTNTYDQTYRYNKNKGQFIAEDESEKKASIMKNEIDTCFDHFTYNNQSYPYFMINLKYINLFNIPSSETSYKLYQNIIKINEKVI